MTQQPHLVNPERSFAIEHTFRAPAAKVFAAYTDPALVPLWWAPKGASLKVEEMEVRAGGHYRFVQTTAAGQTLVFVGRYLEVEPVTRLVYTFMIEGQGNEVKTTVELRETGAGTALRLTNEFPSAEAREAAMKWGAEGGARAAMRSLEAFLAKAAAPAAGGGRA